MGIFPTQYSTLSSSALNDSIEKSYGFSGLTCKLLLHGVSDTYLLKGPADKYILKIYRNSHRSLDEIKGEVELLNILNEQGAKVSYPVRDLNGEQIQAFNAAEGIRHGVVFNFAPGKNIYDFTDEQLRVIGNEMAFNHNITSQINLSYERKNYDIETTLTRPLRLTEPWFADEMESYSELEAIAERVIRKMETFHTASFSYGYCHYDYLPKNFHFDGDTFTLFDFDFAGKGFLANDHASFLVHFFFHTATGKLAKEEGDRQFNRFLDGYREVRALSDEEIDAIPFLGIMFWIFYLGFACENFDDWSNNFLSPRYLKERVSVIKRFADMYCRF
ncbi:phosphotransferase enzyme family protein [Spirosoma endbachense]|uniref:Phosphotransferase n=1 Tax=Spirosoma endbachense TaxID=2666025 RepID=A0A6P1VPF4_9BACT|nr:phosphotransferase [Spirosoma endbachense]QHV94963.1 phosphotransferase [Spirosoma endbachense]